MDPLSSGIGAAGSLLGGITSSVLSSKAAKRALEAQKEENRINREFNSLEAQKSRDYNTQMVDKANEYNLPVNQVQRLMDAGLHPALAMGGANGLISVGTGATSMEASYGGGASAVLPDFSGIRDAGIAASQTVGNISAAKEKEAVARLTDKQFSMYERLTESQIALNNGIEFSNTESGKLTKTQRENYAVVLENIQAQSDNLASSTALNDALKDESSSRKFLNEVDAFLKPFLASAEMRKNLAAAHLTEEQAKWVGKLAVSTIALNSSHVGVNEKVRDYWQAQSTEAWRNLNNGLPELVADNLSYENETLRIKSENALWLVGGEVVGNVLGGIASVFYGGAALKGAMSAGRTVRAGVSASARRGARSR